jgi:F420-0:gamma-glutamyl ligase
MQFIPVKTEILPLPKGDLYALIDAFLPPLIEGDVIFITSKVVAIHQGRCVAMKDISKEDLVLRESSLMFPGSRLSSRPLFLTVKDNTLIPNAGIDDSKKSGYYILWPENAEAAAEEVCQYLKNKFRIEKLAVVITDTHSTPLRYGFTGMTIGLFGLEPFRSYKGKLDVFGNPIKTLANVVDPLAAMAVLHMGEGDEQTPLLIARGISGIEFATTQTYQKLLVPQEEDIYAPMFSGFIKPESRRGE